ALHRIRRLRSPQNRCPAPSPRDRADTWDRTCRPPIKTPVPTRCAVPWPVTPARDLAAAQSVGATRGWEEVAEASQWPKARARPEDGRRSLQRAAVLPDGSHLGAFPTTWIEGQLYPRTPTCQAQ